MFTWWTGDYQSSARETSVRIATKAISENLPDRTSLQIVADAHSFDLAEFVDEPGFYLAVLIAQELKN
ncbi:hypothetical protein Ahy_B10g104213 [Arachis hypogaea]|uniref:Uncharacterized protein n=1 Tax=Arachis hypogaea TaxID=3818 RepID=A0A444X4Y3_ARAHY|nr:hypothetical protein Ahy_B10g104213 [Arachis hypogaea]